ncbi:hypothetical protein CRUP_020808 [Coryphaenoides rupestris]|nr:hypothetical protein CRUP_020808 [Coryphaenoides rupestris]
MATRSKGKEGGGEGFGGGGGATCDWPVYTHCGSRVAPDVAASYRALSLVSWCPSGSLHGIYLVRPDATRSFPCASHPAPAASPPAP